MTSSTDTKAQKERIELSLPEERMQEWSTLAFLALKKKYAKIGQVIEEMFDVKFETPTSSNSVSNPIRSITFYGDPAVQSKIETVFNVLLEDINRPPDARRYLNRAAVMEIGNEVKETGTYSPKVFVPTVGTGNKSTAKREATPAQEHMREMVRNLELTFGIGPAGTGKTFVAMEAGMEALIEGERLKKPMKLLLARPATEAGENIGFLPGTQEDKLAPYMRPLYDELDKTIGRVRWKKMMELGQIEVVPVGFMRGRTFDDAFIILDEAQNLTEEQLEMAATRIGYNSKMVITGDPYQIDLKPKSLSALMDFVDIMKGKKGVGVQEFQGSDCVRSEMAQTIVSALAERRAQREQALAAKATTVANTPVEQKTSTPKVKKPSRLVQAFEKEAPAKKAPAAAAPTKTLKAALDKVAPAAKAKAGAKATKTAQTALQKAIPAPTAKGTMPVIKKPAAMTAKKKA